MTGYWVLTSDQLMAMLRQVEAGEDPGLVYAEHYANSEVEVDDDAS